MEEEKKKLTKRDFVIAILMILILSGFSFWYFKNWKKSISEIKPPKIEIPSPETLPKKEGYKEWVSPNGKLKLKYPADWTEIDKRVLEEFPKENLKESEILFFAQKFTLEKVGQAFMIVEKLNFKESSLEEVFEKIQRTSKEREIEIEILEKKEGENEIIFEALYKKGKMGPFHSKEELIKGENEFLLVSILTFEPYWPQFKEEIEEILRNLEYS